MTAETLQWVNILISGGVLFGLMKVSVQVGRVLQRQEEHERRIGELERAIVRR